MIWRRENTTPGDAASRLRILNSDGVSVTFVSPTETVSCTRSMLIAPTLRMVWSDAAIQLAPPQQRVDPTDQLDRRERLRHVVVGAHPEPFEQVALGIASRQHDDRHRALSADPAARVGTRELRQHHVENDQVDRLRQRHRDSLGAVDRHIHLEALALEGVLQPPHQRRLIVDDQNPRAHAASRTESKRNADPHDGADSRLGLERDLAAQDPHRLPRDRQARGRSRSPHGRPGRTGRRSAAARDRGCRCPVSEISITAPASSSKPRKVIVPAVVCSAAFIARVRSACSIRSAFAASSKSDGQSTAAVTPGRSGMPLREIVEHGSQPDARGHEPPRRPTRSARRGAAHE